MSKISVYLLQLLSFIPSIAAEIQSAHAAKSLDDKVAVAQSCMNVAAQAAATVAPSEQSNVAVALQAASQLLASSIAAVHSVSSAPATA
jgi:hypothetical protein